MTAPQHTESAEATREAVRSGVIGLGNPLRGDDGVVPELFGRLRAPDGGSDSTDLDDITLLEFGDANFRLVHALSDFDRVLIVDAVRFGGEPGDHVVFSPEEVVSRADHGGSHDSDLLELVELARYLNEASATVRIFGIQPGPMEMGPGLSDPLESRLPELLEALEDAIYEL